MTYKGCIQVLGFVPVEVEADSEQEARRMIENDPTPHVAGEIESLKFEVFESFGPKE